MTSIKEFDHTYRAFGHRFGFVDKEYTGTELSYTGGLGRSTATEVTLGPLGTHRVPVSAKVGWSIVICVVILAVVAAVVGAVVVRKKRARRQSHTY